ncbi:NUDIX domain-containing protein [Candidatus Woesearchaeota archaeon]|nr:NUDIX domain-containing protein [Candidatus Woesearchaeota archaeon]
MSKDDQQIMVVPREILFAPSQQNLFEGFRPADDFDYERRILRDYRFIRRGDAETDPSYKQPIPYMLIIHQGTKQIFSYQRSAKEHDEERLRGKWSWGIGGHVEAEGDWVANPLQSNMLRELQEEVLIPEEASVKTRILGYINYESDEVSQVHFGLLYVVQVNTDQIKPKDKEIDKTTAQFRTVEELEKICGSRKHIVEAWSQIAVRPLKDYLRT